MDADLHHIAGVLALGVLLPAWLVFGFLDWWHHRKSDIAETSGWRESGLHLLLVGQAGMAVLAALFLEPTALVLGLVIAAFLAHEVTTGLDIGYAAPIRLITAHEQRVHNYLTAIPLALLMILIIINGGQFAALFGLGTEAADFSLRWRENPLPTWYLVTWLLLSPVNALLYLEEFARCLKARQAPKYYGF